MTPFIEELSSTEERSGETLKREVMKIGVFWAFQEKNSWRSKHQVAIPVLKRGAASWVMERDFTCSGYLPWTCPLPPVDICKFQLFLDSNRKSLLGNGMYIHNMDIINHGLDRFCRRSPEQNRIILFSLTSIFIKVSSHRSLPVVVGCTKINPVHIIGNFWGEKAYGDNQSNQGTTTMIDFSKFCSS